MVAFRAPDGIDPVLLYMVTVESAETTARFDEWSFHKCKTGVD